MEYSLVLSLLWLPELRLIPKLSATRSIVSMFSEEVLTGTLAGNRALMNAKPGKNRTKMVPSAERR